MALSPKNAGLFQANHGTLVKAFECEECGAERMETETGRVCPNFHGRIHRKIPKAILKHLRALRRAKSLPMATKCRVRWSPSRGDRIKNANVFVIVGGGDYSVYRPLDWHHIESLKDGEGYKAYVMPCEALKKIKDGELPVIHDEILEANYNGEPFWLFRVGYIDGHWPRFS